MVNIGVEAFLPALNRRCSAKGLAAIVGNTYDLKSLSSMMIAKKQAALSRREVIEKA
jgi:hypothetical protein